MQKGALVYMRRIKKFEEAKWKLSERPSEHLNDYQTIGIRSAAAEA